jgi:hypothetical protein
MTIVTSAKLGTPVLVTLNEADQDLEVSVWDVVGVIFSIN